MSPNCPQQLFFRTEEYGFLQPRDGLFGKSSHRAKNESTPAAFRSCTCLYLSTRRPPCVCPVGPCPSVCTVQLTRCTAVGISAPVCEAGLMIPAVQKEREGRRGNTGSAWCNVRPGLGRAGEQTTQAIQSDWILLMSWKVLEQPREVYGGNDCHFHIPGRD